MDVSIIIVNYNIISLLIVAVDSVLEKTEGIEYEIIVVDNNSSDNSKNILAEKYGDRVIYFALPENIGFGRANNEGAKIARGRNLFFLNPDTILLNNAVKILSDFMDNNPRVGCCGGNLFDVDGNPTNSFARLITLSIIETFNVLFGNLLNKIIYRKNINFNYTNKPLKVCWITGADLMIRKYVFDRLHGFDPAFFMYCEEVELEYRVRKAGYKVFSVPYAKIIHLEGKSFSSDYDKINKYLISKKIFMQKTNNFIKIYCIYILLYLLIISRILIFSILLKKEKRKNWINKYRIYNKKSKDGLINSINEYFKSNFI